MIYILLYNAFFFFASTYSNGPGIKRMKYAKKTKKMIRLFFRTSRQNECPVPVLAPLQSQPEYNFKKSICFQVLYELNKTIAYRCLPNKKKNTKMKCPVVFINIYKKNNTFFKITRYYYFRYKKKKLNPNPPGVVVP